MKRVRKLVTVEQKINMLDKLEFVESVASVGRHYHVSGSCVRAVKCSLADIRTR
jgi:hypothetical protein